MRVVGADHAGVVVAAETECQRREVDLFGYGDEGGGEVLGEGGGGYYCLWEGLDLILEGKVMD